MQHTFGSTKRIIQVKDISSIVTGSLIGIYKLMITSEAMKGLCYAFFASAAAWLGQTIAKLVWNWLQPKIISFFTKYFK